MSKLTHSLFLNPQWASSHPRLAFGSLFLILLLMIGLPTPEHAQQPPSTPASPETVETVKAKVQQLPLYFIENRGQFDPQVAYTVQGATTSLYFTPGGVTFALNGLAQQSGKSQGAGLVKASLSSKPEGWAVKLDFLGANPAVKPQAEARPSKLPPLFKLSIPRFLAFI